MSLRELKLVSLVATVFLPTLLSLLVVVSPVQAQSTGNIKLLCEGVGNLLSWPGTDGRCASTDKPILPTSIPSNFTAICLIALTNADDEILNAVTTAGQLSCDQYKGLPDYYDSTLVKREEISGTPPTTVTPPVTTPPVTTPPTIKPTPTIKPPVSSGGTSTVNDAGGCPTGFTSKGPLCIPNNPFGGGGIAGKGTIGELAATIISILLSMAGIVAVIMVIYGGYEFMTARGNETQSTNGRKTLVNALIGLAIVIVSYAVVQAISSYLISK